MYALYLRITDTSAKVLPSAQKNGIYTFSCHSQRHKSSLKTCLNLFEASAVALKS